HSCCAMRSGCLAATRRTIASSRQRACSPARTSRCRDAAAPRPWRRVRSPAVLPPLLRGGIGFHLEALLLCGGALPASGVCARIQSLALLVCRSENQSHGARKGIPLGFLGSQLLSPARSQAVIFGSLPLIRQLPRSINPALGFQPVKRRIERPGLDL